MESSKKTSAKKTPATAKKTPATAKNPAQEMSNRPSDLNKVPDSPPATEIRPESRRSGVEVQVSVDLLLRARHQVMKSADVDPPSKKILDDLINAVIEPLDLGAAVEKNRFLRCKIVSDEIDIKLSHSLPAMEIGLENVKLVETDTTEGIQAACTLLEIKSSSTEQQVFLTPEEEAADILLLVKSSKEEVPWSTDEISLLMEKAACEDDPNWDTIQELFSPNRSKGDCIKQFHQQMEKAEANQASHTKGKEAANEE
ncbi:hypothetical protein CKAN_02384200 [Cinnamomum micranthum f. kanehirae]|uniref:Myb-like domain-containing protein n=1 Tax=Cinnamomum micranthum f. kanehirae TaxID=337451 RepID=A0A3S3NLH6_9MAGN|nr:hypothetical protein CKAN_02384200 [Cinnamomum micranthum f. kanehirae]